MGFYGGLNFNFHTPNFTYGVYDLQDPLSPMFVGNMRHISNNTGLGGNFGLIANIPLDNMFVLSGRFGYNTMGGDLKDSVGTNTTSTNLNYLEVTPALQIHNLLEGQGLYLLAGLEIGIPLTKTYQFDYFSTLNNVPYSGAQADIPDVSTRFALAIGAGWVFELSDDIFLSPEISYRLPFGKVSKSEFFDTWEIPQLRASVSLTFGIRSDDTEDVITANKPEINVGMKDVTGLNMEGARISSEKIVVEETQYTELFPVIPYVFFDENSDSPNKNTQELAATRQSGSFNVESIEPDAIKINSYTLDIIGTRMQGDKNSAIKIIGTVDAKSENPKSDLAKKRAEFAKNYLVVNYGIEPNRINTESTGLPSKPSSIRDPEGIEENRRVEIVPINANSSLLKPIIIESDKQRLATPPIIQFTPNVTTNEEIDSWELELQQSGNTIKRYSGYGSPDKIQWTISPNELASNEIPADYNLTVWTKSGNKGNYSSSIPIEFLSISKKKSQESPDKSISKYSLVLFDFNSPEISEMDKKILFDNVIPSIKYNSTVQIYGYTDRIGSEDYNKKLASQRANSVKDLLMTRAKDAKYEVFGVGEGVQIFDNNLTSGRQLSRTVQVYVITPKK